MWVKCTNCTVSCTSSLGLGVRIMGAEFQPSARKEEALCLAPARAALSIATGVLEVGTCPERHPLALDCAGPRDGGRSSSRAPVTQPHCLRGPVLSALPRASVNQHFHSAALMSSEAAARRVSLACPSFLQTS